ncbi:hypothetical protein [Antribacter gilvus]|uniref:hypothetical protein n=1 Tax=Antribacter gilvus TaxID=2304675 RepID=UPI000F781B88|nr:hypothetical protein [Antribacter gilvus]
MRSNKAMVTRARTGHPVPALAHAGAVSGVAAGFASLTEAVEAVTAIDSLLASLAASRAVLVESVRVWADERPELSGHEEPGTGNPAPGAGDAAESAADGVEPEDAILPPVLVEALAAALRIPEGSVLALAEESRALVHEHPRTLAALRGGRITYGHAQTILGYTDGLHRTARTALETRLLKRSQSCTVAELSVVARTERERRLPPALPPAQEGERPVRRAARPPHRVVARSRDVGQWPAQRRRQRSSQAGSAPVSATAGSEGAAGAS